jgi:stearoyl-CoA desaturase (Delta-9 desaturase)
MSLPGPAPMTSGSTTYVLGHGGGGAAQFVHAAAILALPTVAILIAAWQTLNGTVRLWQPLLTIALYVLTMTGITVGFHRLLAHRALQAHSAVLNILVVLGCMATQGPPIYWVSNHRRHHQFGDAVGDPHSPNYHDDHDLRGWAGFWHAHIGWTFTHELTNPVYFCKDLLRDRSISRINRQYYVWVLLGLAVPTAAGGLIEGSINGALNGLLWGGGVRLFISYHLTNSINSITHMFGYRSFNTPECSRNNLFLGLPTLGEAWHNNHHAFPSSAIFGYTWWELDIGGVVIFCLERLRLVWNVRRPDAEMIAEKCRFATKSNSDEVGAP